MSEKYSKFRRIATRIANETGNVIATLAVFEVLLSYGVSFTNCIGPSMLPTINESGDFVLIDRFSYDVLGKEYKKGDVIVSLSPYDRHKSICKRIVAVEGDIIPIPSGRYPFNDYGVVPRGHVYIAGDNPKKSIDSRQYGPIPTGLLRGRVVCKIHNPFYNSNIIEWVKNDVPPWQKA
mmetsp:Transcript_24199/g.22004  ORF Transcript_24199/g.22004 Transcript_24199/m.22004 type:complete len:178 (+) Transcript_24199:43-576(+)